MATKETIDVTVTIGSPSLSKAGFGTQLFICESDDAFTDRVKSYSALEDVLDDFASTDVEYLAATAAFSQPKKPPAFKIGRKETTDADYTAAITAIAAEDNDFYFLTMASRTQADILLVAAWAEANNKFFATCENTKATPNATALEALEYDRTLCCYHSSADGSTSDEWFDVAWCARMAYTTPGSTVWAEKDVEGISSDTFGGSEITALEAVNCNYMIEVRGSDLPYVGKVVSGEWADTIRFADWLQEEIAYNTLDMKVRMSQKNSKVPYTAAGIQQFVSPVETALLQGVENGGLAAAGETPAYEITYPDINDVTTAEKFARALSDVNVTGQLAGAILYGSINVYLEV